MMIIHYLQSASSSSLHFLLQHLSLSLSHSLASMNITSYTCKKNNTDDDDGDDDSSMSLDLMVDSYNNTNL